MYENSKIDLNSITYLFRPRFPMNEKQKEWFLGNSSAFCKLEYLDLGMACIDDEFIYELCLFDFERLRGIDLSGNPAITSAALQHILDSDSLGMVLTGLTLGNQRLISLLESEVPEYLIASCNNITRKLGLCLE